MASCGDESLVSGGASPLLQLQQQQEQQRQGRRRTDPAESKADAPHSNVQSLFEAVVHVRALLDAEQQSAVLSECCALYSRLGPAAHYGSVADIMRQRAHRGKYLLFFENSPDAIPQLFADAAARAFEAAHGCCAHVPAKFAAARMNSRLYPLGSSLEAHLDSHEAWVLLLSLGCSATFLLRPRGCDAKRVEMASGDAIIFHGGARWQVEHAVERIVPDTCPEHLAALLARGRIGLQLRGAEDTGDARAWTREAGPRETSLY